MTKTRSSVLCSIVLLLLISATHGQTDRPGIFDPETHGKLGKLEMRWVVDNLYIQLRQNPTWIGLIVLEFDESETRKDKIARIRLIEKAITYRKYDASRLFVAIAQKARAHEYIILPGEKLFPLAPSEFKIFGLPQLIKNPNIAFPTTKINRPK